MAADVTHRVREKCSTMKSNVNPTHAATLYYGETRGIFMLISVVD